MNRNTGIRFGKTAAVVALICCLILTMTRAGQAAETMKGEEKIVLCWMIQLQDLELAKEWAKIKELPFNGMVFRPANYLQIMRPREIPWSDWQQEVDELKSVEFGHFKDNFLYLNVSLNHPGSTVDWFDDWVPVVQNLKNMAKAAKLAGLKGLIWDAEGYTATPHFRYPGRSDKQTRARAEYEVRVRGLAEEIMTEIREVYPDLTIMSLFGYSVSDQPTLDLLPSFLDGLLAASDPRFTLVDGQEGSYYDKDKADFACR